MEPKDENGDIPSVVVTPPRIPSLPNMGNHESLKQQRRVSDTFESDMDGEVKNTRGKNEFSSKTSLNGKNDSRKFSISSNRRKYSSQDDRDSTYWKISTDRLNVATRRKMSTCSTFSESIVPPELVLSSCVNSSQDLSQWDSKPKRTTFKSALPEIFASCAATSFHIIVGVTFAATASLLPQLQAPDSDIQASQREVAWIASIFVIVVPFASIFSGFIMERFGRLNAVKLAIVPSIISCALISLATNVEMVIGGRFFMGIGAALGTNPAVVYITEITSPEYRGALVSAGPTLSSLGMMLGYAFGAFLPWRTVSWINIAYCLIPIFLILILRVPESPVWLVSKNRIDLAKQNLMWINRWEDESTREKNVERELKALMKDRDEKREAATSPDGKISIWSKFSGLLKPTGYKPLIIMIILFTFQQYTGVYITTFYAVQFFKESGAAMNPFHASILIGLTRFVMSVVTVFLLKKFGRRPLCITSCIGMAVFMGISGYFTYQVNLTGEPSYVPVAAILIYVCFCMIGLLSLPWTMAAEVFPTEIRELAHGLVIAGAHIVMFISVQTYHQMSIFFGGHDGLQWFFGVMSLLALVFVYFFLPETHGKTLFEIEHYFQNHTVYSKEDIFIYDDDDDDSNQNIIKKNNYESNIKVAEQTKPIDRKYSVRNVEILAALPENLNEYDTLIRQSEEKYPSIIEKNDKDSKFGNYDLSKIEYIDKSAVELDKL